MSISEQEYQGFEARVASGASGGNIEIRLDGINGTLIGTCSVAGTGGWQTWTTRTCSLSGVTGTHNVYLKFTGGSGFLFNLNWFKFIPEGPQTGVNYKIVNRNSGKLLDVNNGSTADGGDVIQWKSNGGANQQWKLEDAGSGYYYIINVNSGKALDVDNNSTADGGNIIQWTKNSGYNQQWKLEGAGNGYYYLVNRNSSKVADVSNQSTADGADVLQMANNAGTSQQWQLVQ